MHKNQVILFNDFWFGFGLILVWFCFGFGFGLVLVWFGFGLVLVICVLRGIN